ncbi:CDP-glycerol glycerophosphotransferase family protein [Natrarchaeobaculum aegyptiacum]|uniref:CDP-glycerol--glycerophosphate glycerophosphotransferase n=1 Tax=Natrarchaeobaculum aegyptiacum TaxID=745377 RepID=A0A2Z2HU72_9EURY|nr:CDP-glycerol glycerophosphotransferase family protein [Natrarchaeobaculum aegyptiacum]ARS90816.1 hypothetical protein B1756_14525 [Natrarchaeobaculum aegyptiacum]
MVEYLRRISLSIIFGVIDLFVRQKRSDVMICTQYAILDADVKPLLDRLSEVSAGQIYVCVQEDQLDTSTNDLESPYNDQVTIVESDTFSFLFKLATCRLVVLEGPHHLHGYRLFWQNYRRTCVLFYHGVITKAYRRHANDNSSPSLFGRVKNTVLDWYLYTGIDAQSVASDVERFFRSSAEGRHPAHFETLGYPRYDRIAELLSDDPSPPPEEIDVEELKTDHDTILYAPTHKDGAYRSTPFPFENFELEELRTFLREQDARLFLRMHPNEEDSGIYEKFVDGETIFYAGQDRSPSSLELLAHVDVLVTDYSSIYMDFLPFDRPVIFVTDRHEQFVDQRGIAFDYDRYFPGKTIDSAEEFLEHLETCLAGDETFSEDRSFVRRVLLPNWKESTVEKVLAFSGFCDDESDPDSQYT